MNTESNIDSQEILNAIDLGKINLTDKKKRGRPKKSQQLINPGSNKVKINNVIFEQDEIILHLPISTSDIKTIKSTSNFDNKDTETELESDDSADYSKTKDVIETKIKKEDIWNDINHKQYTQVIKKLKEENEKLKKYLIEITPMYFTEVKIYPVDLQLFDLQGNTFIPKKTNIPCFWCTYTFDWFPVCGAEKYHNEIFYVTDNFCSFNCWAAHNLKRGDNGVWERYALMKLLYYKINKDSITSISDIEINPAGPKELLEKYGGPMTIEDYRKNSKILGREYHKLIPPFMPMTMGFEESTNSKSSGKNMNINSILNAASKDSVIVKRNKPLSNVASKEIDDFIE